MPGNTTTYTINFKAQADDIQKVLSVVQNIQKQIDSNSLKLTDANKKKMVELEAAATNLQRILGERVNPDGSLSPENFRAIIGLFDNLTNKVGVFQRAILSLAIPKELQAEIDALTRALETAAKKRDEASKLKNTRDNPQFAGYNVDKATGIATVTKNFVDKTTIQEAGGLQAVSGAQITTYKQLQKAINLINKAKTDLNSLTAQEREAYERIKGDANNYVAALNNVNAAYDAAKAREPEISAMYQQYSLDASNTKREYIELKNQLAEKIQLSLDAKEVTAGSKEAATALTKLHDEMEESGTKAVNEAKQKHKEYQQELNKTKKATEGVTQAQDKNDSVFGKAVKNVVSYGTALQLVRNLYNKFISTIKEMDEALTNMTVVTQLSREQAWNLVGTLQTLAKETGMTTTEVANMTTMYLQQGKTLSDALELTEAAAKAARIAGISGSESINLLTNAMNGFQLSASQAMEVSDKFAALAASAATDYEELATALSKVAAQANLAGMSMDFTLGLLTKGIEVTREAPETIGTALKTVISRMRELTDYGQTLEDSIDVNRVDKALQNIGVSLLDENRQFRDLEDVLTEVGAKWSTLNTNQQANVAVALAGTRQQSRLIAMMQDFDRTQELVNISMNSAGATAAQHRKYMEGLEAATAKLTTSYQGLITSFMNSDLAIGVINKLASGLEFLGDNIGIVYAALGSILVLYGPLLANKLADNVATAAANFLSLAYADAIDKERKARDLNTLSTQTGLLGIKQTIAAKFAEITGIKLATIETNKNTGATFANAAAEQFSIIATNLRILASKGKNKALKDEARSAITTALADLGLAGAQNLGALSSLLWAGTLKILKGAFEALPIVGWIAAIVGLVIGLVRASSTTESFTGTLKSLGDVLKSLFDVVMQIFNIIVELFALISEWTVGLMFLPIEWISNILQIILEVIRLIVNAASAVLQVIKGWIEAVPGLGVLAKKLSEVGGTLKKAVNKVKDWADGASDAIISIFGTAAQKSEIYAKRIAKNQEIIYEKQQLKNTLDPLIKEYDELSNKANKSAEDIERLSEIESQIGELNEDYKLAGGGINWDIVKDDAKKAGEEAGTLLKQGYDDAIAGINTNEIKEEYRSAISDYYSNKAQIAATNNEISATTASAIAKNFQNAMNTMSDEEIKAINKTKGGFEQLYNGVKEFETSLAEDASLSKRMEAFEKEYNKIFTESEEAAANSFAAIYNIYKEYSDLVKGLVGEEKAAVLDLIDTIGLTAPEYNKMKQAFDGTEKEFQQRLREGLRTGANVKRMKGESDVDYNARKQQAVIEFVVSGQSQEFKNAVFESLIQSNQDALEAYTKNISSLDNLEAASKKAAQGTLTLDEIRELQSQYPELFADEEWVAKFKSGQVDINELRKEANDELRTSLEISKRIAESERDSILNQLKSKGIHEDILALEKEEAVALLIAKGYTEEEAAALYSGLLDYTSQIARNDMQLEYLEYADLYATELWKSLEGVTKEQVEQTRIQGELNKLAKEYEATTDPEKRTELLKQQAAAYARMARNAKSMLSDEQKRLYNEAVQKGYIVDGKVVVTREELIGMGANSSMVGFLTEGQEIIEDYHTYTEEYLDGYRSLIELEYDKQKDILEERKGQYETYWDKLDALEQEQERAQSRESILSQLSALAGGSDAASNSLRKDLLSQLADVNKEEAEARKQAMRDAILDNMDDNIQSIDDNIKSLAAISEEGLVALLKGFGFEIPAFANGGLVSFTGPAWVDGTKSHPEAFLDAVDTKLIAQLVESLRYGSLNGILTADDSNPSIAIGNINITANELNTQQDFRASGRIFAEEFAKAMKQRGINRNVKR